MNKETVGMLFKLFSGYEHECFDSHIHAAMNTVKSLLKESEKCDDIRLAFLAAALANMKAAEYIAMYGLNSEVKYKVKYAENLFRSYTYLCDDLLKDHESNDLV